EGKPRVVAVRTAPNLTEDDVLRLAASLERSSQHPLGAAIVRAAIERGLRLVDAQEFKAPAGKGATGKLEGHILVIGNLRIMQEAGIHVGVLATTADGLREEGATVVFVAIDGAPVGVIAIADPIKASTTPALVALRQAGIHVVMLTGDNATTARAIAAKL